jgi:hypothetical protein
MQVGIIFQYEQVKTKIAIIMAFLLSRLSKIS